MLISQSMLGPIFKLWEQPGTIFFSENQMSDLYFDVGLSII
jgi:hypothetical protein